MNGLTNKSSNPKNLKRKFPLVSVIVAAYNEAENLSNLLESIKSQTYPSIETIVIDDASTDNTAAIARSFTSKVFTRPHLERSAQRNYGASIANGLYLLFLDADMRLDAEVITSCTKLMLNNRNVKSIIIPEISYGEGYWAKCKALERNCYVGDKLIEAPRFFYRKDFLKLGGYNPKMISGEDWDFHRRIKYYGKTDRTDNYIYHYEGRFTLFKDLKKKSYYASQAGPFIDSNINNYNTIIKFLFRPAFFKNWNLLLKDPIHAFGMLIMKFLEFVIGGFVIIFQSKFWKNTFRSDT